MPYRRAAWTLLLVVGGLGMLPSPAAPQSSARLTLEENFRREPNGVVLARLMAGATVRVVGREGNWTQVELQGSVWLASTEASEDDAFDLVVSASGGENLRSGPGGEIVAVLEEGALLDERDRDGSWASVVRSGWVWSASLDEETRSPSGPMIQPEEPARPGPAATRPGGFATLGQSGGAILTAPDGDTLAAVEPGRDVQVTGREGNWARVRLEGWLWMPATAAVEPGAVVDDSPATVEPSDLQADPDGYNGRVVAWTLQFISLERAEAVRTDFFEGEPFLLTRYGGADGPFVYVALPADRLAEVEGLVPLEEIGVTARVRTGASVLTGTPIVDLLGIERSREAP